MQKTERKKKAKWRERNGKQREEEQTTGLTPLPIIIFTVLGCLVVWSIVISCHGADISLDTALHVRSDCHEVLGVSVLRTPVGRDLGLVSREGCARARPTKRGVV